MAIDRGPWNALVDDDGSNLVGTVWNKDTIKTVLLDPIDAMPAQPWTSVAFASGIQDIHNWDPGVVGNTLVIFASSGGECNITGIKPAAVPTEGQVVRVIGVPGQIRFFHEHAGSLSGYQFRLRASSVPLSGFWMIAEFQYVRYGGVGGWVQGVTANGQ